jgi:Flp pilus assembly protein TadG
MKVSRAPARRCTSDEGAVLVEAAFIFPILFFMLFGLFDLSLLFRSYLTLGNALRAGARSAAVAGDDIDADYRILLAIKKETGAIAVNSMTRIVIYRATPASVGANPAAVPSACLTAAVTTGTPLSASSCNVYAPSWALASARTSTDFDCSPTTTDVANGWCPDARFSGLTSGGTPNNGPPDWVGVYIEVTHTYVTGFLGRTKLLSDTFVVQIEPKSLQ